MPCRSHACRRIFFQWLMQNPHVYPPASLTFDFWCAPVGSERRFKIPLLDKGCNSSLTPATLTSFFSLITPFPSIFGVHLLGVKRIFWKTAFLTKKENLYGSHNSSRICMRAMVLQDACQTHSSYPALTFTQLYSKGDIWPDACEGECQDLANYVLRQGALVSRDARL